LSGPVAPDLGAAVLAGLEAQAARLRERLASGERRAGWKIALNDPRVQQALGITAPVIGYLTSETVLPSGATHSLSGAARPAIEPEIAVHVGQGGGVAALGAALEVIDVDMPFEDVAAIMERNVFHRAAVLGAAGTGVPELDGLTAHLCREAGDEITIDVAAAALDPEEVLHLVGRCLEAVGDGLRAGDVIIAGSLVTALPLEADGRFELEIERVGSVALDVRSA
jgi:2-keto-4-pentenoate hydratase